MNCIMDSKQNSEHSNNLIINSNNEINNFIQNINNVDNVNDILRLKHQINNSIHSYMIHIENLKKLLETINIKLENTCKHIWKRDYTYYGEHSHYQCSLCELYK